MSNESILAREREIAILDKVWKSKEAEFVAIYGRRRVGKTHLIRSYFSAKDKETVYFELTGIKDARLPLQLNNFAEKLGKVFYDGLPISTPKNWLAAFKLLTEALKKIPLSKKIVFFFDELPWLASRRSGVTQALDYYWNTEWSLCPNLILVVCGSAASWMLDNVINAKGGLHNRLTKVILLEPFDLKQTQQFLKHRKINYTQLQVLDLYMALGGIPHYLKQVERGKSVAQNLDYLCFTREGILYGEFEKLFRSLFEKAEHHLNIVRAIAKKRYGISRIDLLKALRIASGGTLTKRIEELVAAGFVKVFIPYGYKKRDIYYRLVDEYAQFYLQWIEPIAQKGDEAPGYWENMNATPARSSWAGLAFEAVCLKHIEQIGHGLGLKSGLRTASWWKYQPKAGSQESGAQIDMVFDRTDGMISLCEIKYSDKPFVIDKSYASVLSNKLRVFDEQKGHGKTVSMVIVTTLGVKENIWCQDLVDGQVTLKHLFA